MDRIVLLLVTATAFYACSGTDGPSSEPEDGKIPVELSAGVPVVSRAVVETGDSFTAGVGGWETDGVSADYSDPPAWYTTADITASATERAVSLAEKQYYNPDKNIRTCMVAWHPAGEPADGLVAFDNADGTVDAMLAARISGSKEDKSDKVLNFTHRTTQLKFKVVADPSLPEGTTLKRITVKDVRLPKGFNLPEAKVVFDENPGPLTIPGLENPFAIPDEAVSAGEPVMVMPMPGNQAVLEIETSSATFSNVVATIDDDTDFVEGKAYVVTLTFRSQSLALSAMVTEWTHGTGSAEVE